MLTFHQARQIILNFTETTDVEKVSAHLALGRALAVEASVAITLRQGTVLQPVHLALLAEAGWNLIPAFEPAGIGLVAVDSELTGNEPPEAMEPHAGVTALAGVSGAYGALPVDMGRTPEQSDLHLALVRRAFDMAEFVCSLGATAQMAQDVAAVLGGEVAFTEVGHEPGGIAFVPNEEGFWFGLPADPAAALALFYMYVLPAARKLGGHRNYDLPMLLGAVENTRDLERPRWVWARLSREEGDFSLSLFERSEEMTLGAAARANVLALLGDPDSEPDTTPMFLTE